MSFGKDRVSVYEPGIPPEPGPSQPVPGPGIPPQPEPGPPPGEPIPHGHADPFPAEVEPLLEVEPLQGPTEASEDIPWPVDDEPVLET
jgi:hypothetical protein